jgi:hypothetical protein
MSASARQSPVVGGGLFVADRGSVEVCCISGVDGGAVRPKALTIHACTSEASQAISDTARRVAA